VNDVKEARDLVQLRAVWLRSWNPAAPRFTSSVSLASSHDAAAGKIARVLGEYRALALVAVAVAWRPFHEGLSRLAEERSFDRCGEERCRGFSSKIGGCRFRLPSPSARFWSAISRASTRSMAS